MRDAAMQVQAAIGRHDQHQLLRGRDDAADGVQRELLHGCIDRRAQGLLLELPVGLDLVLAEFLDLLPRVGEIAAGRAMCLDRRRPKYPRVTRT
jgi:hypothetical protein